MSIVFVKYRSRWAYGEGSWEYRTFNADISDEALEDEMREEASKHDYSDKFRGMEWERCVPTLALVDSYIRSAEKAVESAQRRLLELKTYKVEMDEPASDTPTM